MFGLKRRRRITAGTIRAISTTYSDDAGGDLLTIDLVVKDWTALYPLTPGSRWVVFQEVRRGAR